MSGINRVLFIITLAIVVGSCDSEQRHHQVAVFGRNITDEDVIVGGIDFNNLTGFVSEPAVWGVEYQIRIQ